MPTPRVEALIARLEKGGNKTQEALGALAPEGWSAVVYREPVMWDVRDLLAHLLSAEEGLLRLAQDVAAGGAGAAETFDPDAFNAEEQQRRQGRSPQELLAALAAARGVTLAWLRTLDDVQLDRMGRHPGLGRVTLETIILGMHGHQLLHLRDVQRCLVSEGGNLVSGS